MANTGVFVLKDESTLVAMQQASFASEDDFQRLLASFPELLVGDQIDPEAPRRFLLVSREQSVASEGTEDRVYAKAYRGGLAGVLMFTYAFFSICLSASAQAPAETAKVIERVKNLSRDCDVSFNALQGMFDNVVQLLPLALSAQKKCEGASKVLDGFENTKGLPEKLPNQIFDWTEKLSRANSYRAQVAEVAASYAARQDRSFLRGIPKMFYAIDISLVDANDSLMTAQERAGMRPRAKGDPLQELNKFIAGIQSMTEDCVAVFETMDRTFNSGRFVNDFPTNAVAQTCGNAEEKIGLQTAPRVLKEDVRVDLRRWVRLTQKRVGARADMSRIVDNHVRGRTEARQFYDDAGRNLRKLTRDTDEFLVSIKAMPLR